MGCIFKSVKCEMKRIGVNVPGVHETLYFPGVTIDYKDPERKTLRTGISELFGRFKKSDYQGIAVCGDFFVLVFKGEWEIISSEGKLLKSIPPSGNIVGANESYFVVRNDDMITGYDKDGKNVGSRKLTAEEIMKIDETGN